MKITQADGSSFDSDDLTDVSKIIFDKQIELLNLCCQNGRMCILSTESDRGIAHVAVNLAAQRYLKKFILSGAENLFYATKGFLTILPFFSKDT